MMWNAVAEGLAIAYPWTKALHVVSVISWMAALLYLPRLFVYHAEYGGDRPGCSPVFKIMERRLLKFIANPASVATWIFGILLVLTPGVVDWSAGWVYVKGILIVGLTTYHHLLVRWWRAFAEDRNERSSGFYRVMNEVPTLLMIGIVVMVIVRPF